MAGALSGAHIGPAELLQQRLRYGQVREALGILEAMDWSIMGDECFRGLSSITNHLLRLELNAEREGELNTPYQTDISVNLEFQCVSQTPVAKSKV